MRTDEEIPEEVNLLADVYKFRRTESGLCGVELVWTREGAVVAEEADLRALVPKAVIEYARANNVSFFEGSAVLGHLAIASEVMSAREIISELSGSPLILRSVLDTGTIS